MRVFVGIDPGMTGALAAVGEIGELLSVIPIPRVKGSTGPQDYHAIKEWFAAMKKLGKVEAALERVSVRPGEGVKSTLTAGTNWGFLKGMLVAIGARYVEPTPQTWKKTLSLPKRSGADRKKGKEDAAVLAAQLFPGIDLTPGRKRIPHDGMADAVLIAEYARRTLS
jgi:crossover junction endodeoxyribonuclease RuvC